MPLTAKSDIESIEPNFLPTFVSEVIVNQYFQVATLSVLVYETLITLDKEANYFWKILRKPVDFVYFVNRYVGIVGATAILYRSSLFETLPMCNFAEWTYNIANWITIISIDYILMIRVLALYSQDRTLGLFLKVLLVLEAGTKLGLVTYGIIVERVILGGLVPLTLCGVANAIPWLLGMIDWLIPLVYGMLLMALALYKAAEYWRMSSGFKGFALVKVLIQDQVMYYALVISCFSFAILGFKLEVSNTFLSNVLTNLGNPSFLCILGSRMLFNLKEAGERGQNEGTSLIMPSSTVSEIDFAEPDNPQRESGGSVENV